MKTEIPMIMRRLWLVAVALGLMVALGGCGKKRPPALAAPGGGTGATTPSDVPSGTETGPDVTRMGTESTESTEYSVSDPETGEGGPLADIHFEYDQSSLTDEAKGILEKHAVWLQSHRTANVIVEGHCDERGTVEYNLALGERRAIAARDYLVSLGVAAPRMRTSSFGKEKPLDPSSNEAAWAKNRRAHFAVSR
jgi:peptidoglycan-associated lipoprotein